MIATDTTTSLSMTRLTGILSTIVRAETRRHRWKAIGGYGGTTNSTGPILGICDPISDAITFGRQPGQYPTAVMSRTGGPATNACARCSRCSHMLRANAI